MKRIATTLLALMVTLIIASLPVIGEEGGMGKTKDQEQQNQKNECLLLTRKCGDQLDSIQQKINRLRSEIERGTAVYTPAELKRLSDKLEDANKTLDAIMYHAGGG